MNDLAACLPASVTLLAPHADATSGQPDGTWDSYAVTLASLGLPEFANVAGFPGTKPLRTTAIDTPAVLTALARQCAVDWYGWQRARHDIRLAGVQPWQPDGLTDLIEWWDSASECSTRARRGVYADLADQLYHAGSPPAGPGPNPTPPSATVSPPGGTEVHTPPQQFTGPVLTAGPVTTGGTLTTQPGSVLNVGPPGGGSPGAVLNTNPGSVLNVQGPVGGFPGALINVQSGGEIAVLTGGLLVIPPRPAVLTGIPAGAVFADLTTGQLDMMDSGGTLQTVGPASGGAVTVQNTDGTQVTTPLATFKVNVNANTGLLNWSNVGGGVGFISWTGLPVQVNGTGVGTEPAVDFEQLTNVIITATDESANKRVKVNISALATTEVNGAPEGTEANTNFIAGTGITITGSDDAGNQRVNVTIGQTGGGSAGSTAWGYHLAGSGPNRRYFGGVAVNTSAPSSGQFAANTMFAVPFLFAGGGSTIDTIGVKVNTSAASTKVRLGVYSNVSASNPYPASLLGDSGDIATTTTGVLEASVSVSLTPGSLYWLTLLTTDSSGSTASTVPNGVFFNQYAGSAQGMWPILGGANDYGGSYPLGWSVAHAYGALPGTFPSGGALLVTGGANNAIPMVGVRIS